MQVENETLASPYAAQPSKLQDPTRSVASAPDVDAELSKISGADTGLKAAAAKGVDEALGAISGLVPESSPIAQPAAQPLPEMNFLQRGQISYGTGLQQKFDIVKDMVGPDNVRLAKQGDEEVIQFRMPGEGEDKFRNVDDQRFTLNDIADMFGGVMQAMGTAGAEAALWLTGGPALGVPGAFGAGALGVGVNRAIYRAMYGKSLPGDSVQEATEAAMLNGIFSGVGRGAMWLGKNGERLVKEWHQSSGKQGAKAFVKLKTELQDILSSMAGPEAKAVPDSLKVGRELVGNVADGSTPKTAQVANQMKKKQPAMYRIQEKLGDEIGVYSSMVDDALRQSGQGISVDPYLNRMVSIAGKPGFFAGGPPGWKPMTQSPDGRMLYNKLPLSAQAIEDVAMNRKLGSMNSEAEYKRFANLYNGLVTLRQGSKEEILNALDSGELQRNIDGFILEPSMSMAEREAAVATRNELLSQLRREAKYRVPSVNGDGNYGVSATTLQNYLDTAKGLAKFDSDASDAAKSMYKQLYGSWADQKHQDFGKLIGAEHQAGYLGAVRKYQENIGTVRNFIQLAEQTRSADSVLRSFFTPDNYESAEKIKALVLEENPNLWRDVRASWLGDAISNSTTPEGLISGSKLVNHIDSMGRVKDLIFDSDQQYKSFVAKVRKLDVLSKKIAADSPELTSTLSDLFLGLMPRSAGVAGIASSTSLMKVAKDLVRVSDKRMYDHVQDALLDVAKKAETPSMKQNALYARDLMAKFGYGAAKRGAKMALSLPGRQAALQFALSRMAEKPFGQITQKDISPEKYKALKDLGFSDEDIDREVPEGEPTQ